jgi:hypothetical protein
MNDFLFRRKFFIRSSDFILSLSSAIFVNSSILYFMIVHKEPVYFHYDEAIWVSQSLFCGGNFPFDDQKWGLVIPLLCLIYPLKYIIEPYYFSAIRVFLVFLDMYLLLKLLNSFFSKRISLIIFFFHFSNIFSLLRLLSGKIGDETFISNVYGNTLRVFNPSFFLIFLLLFLIYFVRFLDLEEKQEKIERQDIIFAGIFLGLSFYSLTFWWIYLISSTIFLFFVLLLFRKSALKDVFKVLVLGVVLGLPALIFNLYQKSLVGESILRAAFFIKIHQDISLVDFLLKEMPKEYTFLFVLSLFSFAFYSNFSSKYLFIFSGFFSGFLLFFSEYILKIFMQGTMHFTVPFKLFTKIAIGLALQKFEELRSKKLVSYLFSFAINILCIFMFIFFILNWALFFFKVKKFEENAIKIKQFKEVALRIKYHTPEKSVVTVDDFYGFFILFDIFPTSSELMLHILSEKFILHNNINYFSDLTDNEIFERFIIRSKLLGLSEDEFKDYIYNISKREHVFWGSSPYSTFVSKAYFGEPKDFKFSQYKNIYEAIDDFVKVALRYYQDERYFEDLLKRYKVDYVIRKKPYQGEWYLREETKIGEFYIFRVIKEKE